MKIMKKLVDEESTGIRLDIIQKVINIRLKQIEEDSLIIDTVNDEFNELSKMNSLIFNLLKIKKAQETNTNNYNLCDIRYYKEPTEDELLVKLEKIKKDCSYE